MSMRLQSADDKFVAVMSYAPYDSIRRLIAGLTGLLEDGRAFIVPWNAEPEQFDFSFRLIDGDVELLVARHASRADTDTGEQIFHARCNRSELCQKFWREFKHLRDRSDTDGFEKNWRRPFPESELQALTQSLKQHRHERQE
jgi:hypothetical protein